MVQLLEYPFFVEEEAPLLDLSMPRVYRRPSQRFFRRNRAKLSSLLLRLEQAHTAGDAPGFGKAYGELTSEFQPAIQWAHSCWEYLLSTRGCRFLARPEHEKQYCRGDYKVFTEPEFQSMVYRVFKELLAEWLSGRDRPKFEGYLRESFWASVDQAYRSLEDPPDRNQRKLTGWSYLRCVPYEFLNPYHHERVYGAVGRLPADLRSVVELYYFCFYREEAVVERAQISLYAFRRRRALALRRLAGADYLSSILLRQIERY
ncbi:MAG: hypothetical protein HYZ94_01110 [Candidatus Omnitrophica bacterium]|nr:hypothetical protein [Candidatus Omnitrophota bacterium]